MKKSPWLLFALALAARAAIVAWAHGRFPAAEDGHYYDVLARRLASGLGYTWAWPDGAVTSAALYPVGYPALLALAYAALGASTTVAMGLNAILGSAGAYAAHRLVDAPGVARWRPMAAGLVVALHPALVPYTAALMTEGVTASLLLVAAALAARARVGRGRAWAALAGAVVGVATLVRPQSLLLAPVLGALACAPGSRVRGRALRAAGVSLVALACVAPWTARNCAVMHRCALVSVNGGWNLLIGTQTKTGAYAALAVPAECATVWDEAQKDACFEAAALRSIARAPLAWAEKAPAKLAATFDYLGAAPWYLHASAPGAFGDEAKWRLGAAETVACRLLLLGALVACGRLPGPRSLARKVVALGGAIGAVGLHGWIGYVALALVGALLGPRAWARMPVAVPCAAAVVGLTAAVHAVFFGAGRYGLVAAPFVAAAAFVSGAAEPSRSRRS